MKYHIPDDYAVFEEYGFNNNNDTFKRKEVADSLTSIISNSDDSLVISLDAPWGEGKTAFLHMWQKTLKDQHIPVIYFDAFKNDHHQDPFPPLSSAIYELAKENQLSGDETAKAFAEGVGKFLKSGVIVGSKALTRMAAHQLFGEPGFEGIAEGLSDDISNEIVIGEKFLNSYTNQEATMQAFNKSLTVLARDLLDESTVEGAPTASKNIIFIIDELDRCRPDYALALIELIKHVFSAQGVCFVLSMNKPQLAESLKVIYGAGFDSLTYLDKFIHITTSLPKVGADQEKQIFVVDYITNAAASAGIELYTNDIDLFRHYFHALNLPLRVMNKSIINFGIYNTVKKHEILRHPSVIKITIGLCVLKAYKPDVFEYLSNLPLTKESSAYEFCKDKLPHSFFSDKAGKDWQQILNGPNKPSPLSPDGKSRAASWSNLNPEWSSYNKMIYDICRPLKYFNVA
ncbi:KAP family P-loop NTPase fold protein [Neptunomonas japonica]|uniref:KAP family P-loop NTPase fold protein n=1 Tax=Neptunomonas japonica TaxID=417574 RepID=UPI00041698A6|nr:P-loop NTPase fold protein [Neptunomonas japonica]